MSEPKMLGPWPWMHRGKVVPEDYISPGMREYAERTGATHFVHMRGSLTVSAEAMERMGARAAVREALKIG